MNTMNTFLKTFNVFLQVMKEEVKKYKFQIGLTLMVLPPFPLMYFAFKGVKCCLLLIVFYMCSLVIFVFIYVFNIIVRWLYDNWKKAKNIVDKQQ